MVDEIIAALQLEFHAHDLAAALPAVTFVPQPAAPAFPSATAPASRLRERFA